MKVTISQVAPTKSGLRLGLRIEHEKAGWVRFATTVLLLDRLTYSERAMLLAWLENTRSAENWEDDDPLFILHHDAPTPVDWR